jgi:polyhydroxyalkanoate synthesis regulator phasin
MKKMSNEQDPKETPEETDAPEWKRVEEFGIVTQMRTVVEKTVDATQQEIDMLRRKLERLQYGG